MNRDPRIEQCIRAVNETAAALGIPVSELSRDLYTKERPVGAPSKKVFSKIGGWSVIKKLAAQGHDDTTVHIDPLPEGMDLKGVSTLQNADGEIRGQWILARKVQESREQVLERLLHELPETVPVRQGLIPAPDGPLPDDVLAVYPLGDPHLGLLAWSQETLAEDYNLRIARSTLQSAIDNLVGNQPFARKALIANLGDFFHSDNSSHTTGRSGNSLDVDSRWVKILSVGLDTMVYLVDRCLEMHQEVKVINEIGNHDDHSAIMLSIALDRHYRNEPRVQIDLSPARYHYHQFGRNLIGVTHGHGAKHADLESIMACDQRALWSETEHRYWLVGHIHHSTKKDFRNCSVESFRTLAPRDAWHTEQGYRSARDMCRIALHREFGEIARSTVSARLLGSLGEGK